MKNTVDNVIETDGALRITTVPLAPGSRRFCSWTHFAKASRRWVTAPTMSL